MHLSSNSNENNNDNNNLQIKIKKDENIINGIENNENENNRNENVNICNNYGANNENKSNRNENINIGNDDANSNTNTDDNININIINDEIDENYNNINRYCLNKKKKLLHFVKTNKNTTSNLILCNLILIFVTILIYVANECYELGIWAPCIFNTFYVIHMYFKIKCISIGDSRNIFKRILYVFILLLLSILIIFSLGSTLFSLFFLNNTILNLNKYDYYIKIFFWIHNIFALFYFCVFIIFPLIMIILLEILHSPINCCYKLTYRYNSPDCVFVRMYVFSILKYLSPFDSI